MARLLWIGWPLALALLGLTLVLALVAPSIVWIAALLTLVVGAIVLAKVEQGELDAGQLRRWLDQSLTRVDDRELFSL